MGLYKHRKVILIIFLLLFSLFVWQFISQLIETAKSNVKQLTLPKLPDYTLQLKRDNHYNEFWQLDIAEYNNNVVVIDLAKFEAPSMETTRTQFFIKSKKIEIARTVKKVYNDNDFTLKDDKLNSLASFYELLSVGDFTIDNWQDSGFPPAKLKFEFLETTEEYFVNYITALLETVHAKGIFKGIDYSFVFDSTDFFKKFELQEDMFFNEVQLNFFIEFNYIFNNWNLGG